MQGVFMRTQEARALFKKVFRESIREKSDVLDEAAFPAYAHRNPLIDHIFWGRLAAAERYISARPPKAVLDFGCGSGVMSYILSGLAERVVATDIEPTAFHVMQSAVGFPANIAFVSATELEEERYQLSFDAILALDVLEHVNDLRQVLLRFEELLRPGGVVVISGPTENPLYRLGRRLAGNRFTGEYHLSNIASIKAMCRQHGFVQPIAKLYRALPLFEVFSLQFDQ
jgi:2-polyprenyl-3-methyl-5-hydroxy-6-metoxy-1,4-benzoquinol methylase